MTLGAIHISQVPESGWPRPLPPPIGCNLSTNRKRKPKGRRCVAASIAVGPSAIPTGSQTRPSDWGWNGRFGPVEGRRNSRRLVTVTCIIWILQIWVAVTFAFARGDPQLLRPPNRGGVAPRPADSTDGFRDGRQALGPKSGWDSGRRRGRVRRATPARHDSGERTAG
jgi:hypothetical protein